VACVNQNKESIQLAQTGTLAPTSSTSGAPNPGSTVTDATLVLTALSIEKLAIDTYDAALQANYLTTALLRDVAMYFRDQHRDHAGLLTATAIDLGQRSVVPTVGANAFLAGEIVKPALDTIKGATNDKAKEKATLTLARELEDAAAQTYTKAGGILTTATLRQGIMSIGAIESKHFSVLSELVGEEEVPFAFGPTGGAAPPDAYVRPDVNAVPTTTSTFATTAGSTPLRATPGTTG
jgi:hypothetical protein